MRLMEWEAIYLKPNSGKTQPGKQEVSVLAQKYGH
jgi:hypothetical protein